VARSFGRRSFWRRFSRSICTRATARQALRERRADRIDGARNPAGRKRKVGGKDWTERRLFEQIRGSDADFVLLRQARCEAISSTCDLAVAQAFVESLAALPIRVRHLAQPSPFVRVCACRLFKRQASPTRQSWNLHDPILR